MEPPGGGAAEGSAAVPDAAEPSRRCAGVERLVIPLPAPSPMLSPPAPNRADIAGRKGGLAARRKPRPAPRPPEGAARPTAEECRAASRRHIASAPGAEPEHPSIAAVLHADLLRFAAASPGRVTFGPRGEATCALGDWLAYRASLGR